MHDDRWWIWIAVVIVILVLRGIGALFRGARKATGAANTGMARMNAAAERILKERGAAAANPIPRTTPGHKPAPAKPRPHAVPKASATPPVIRRGGLHASGQEPVIQRRR